MESLKLLRLMLLISLTTAMVEFPTSFEEIEKIEHLLNQSTAQIPNNISQNTKNVQNRKMKQLLRELKKEQKGKKNRRLDFTEQFADVVSKISHNVGSGVGGVGKPVFDLVGGKYSQGVDQDMTGLGLEALGTGYVTYTLERDEIDKMMSVLENKYHLNTLFIESINKQNVDAEFAQKTLKKTVGKVTKMKKFMVHKITEMANPLN